MLSADDTITKRTVPANGAAETISLGLVLSAPPSYSESFLRNKIRFLQESGFDVEVFAERKAATEFSNIIYGLNSSGGRVETAKSVISAMSRLLRSPLRAVRLFSLNKESGFSLKRNLQSLMLSSHIIGSNLDWLHFGFATLSIGRENVAAAIGAKLAVSIRGFDIAIYPLKNPRCYETLWSRLDKLHYISDDLLHAAIKDGFDDSGESTKITPAINVSTFRRNDNSIKPRDKRLRICSVARLHWKKGFDYTFAALKELKQQGHSFRYRIIGDGTDYERLVLARAQMDLEDEIEFLGAMPQEKVAEHLSNADVFVQYSIQEGFCNAVLEAQSMGLPCVVSDAEGLAENVLDGVTGWIVEKRRPDLLAAQLIAISEMPLPELTAFSEAATARVQEHFSLDKQASEFIRFYSDKSRLNSLTNSK